MASESKDYDPEFVESTGYGQNPDNAHKSTYFVSMGVNEDSSFYESLYIGKNLYVKENGEVGINLDVKGSTFVGKDVYIGQNLYVKQNANIKLNLQVDGIVSAAGFYIGKQSFFTDGIFKIGVPTEAIRGFASTAGTRLTGGTKADQIDSDKSNTRDLRVEEVQYVPTQVSFPIVTEGENGLEISNYVNLTVLAAATELN